MGKEVKVNTDKQVKSMWLTPDFDDLFTVMEGLRRKKLESDIDISAQIREEVLEILNNRLELSAIKGEFYPTTGTQEVILRAQVSQGCLQSMPAIQAVEASGD